MFLTVGPTSSTAINHKNLSQHSSEPKHMMKIPQPTTSAL